jgi:hypothetical protein
VNFERVGHTTETREKEINMTMLIAVPEGWTNEEWRAKLNYLANQIHWDDESLADEDDAAAEGDWS